MRPQPPQLPDRAPSGALVGVLCLVIGGLSESWLITGIGLLLLAPIALYALLLVASLIAKIAGRP